MTQIDNILLLWIFIIIFTIFNHLLSWWSRDSEKRNCSAEEGFSIMACWIMLLVLTGAFIAYITL